MNNIKNVLYALIVFAGFQGYQIYGMMDLFDIKSSDTVRSIVKANNDYETQINIARIARKYKLSSEQVSKLENTKIKMDHRTLVIPQKSNKVQNGNQLEGILQGYVTIPAYWINQHIVNKNKNAKFSFVIYSGHEAIDMHSQEKSRYTQNMARFARYHRRCHSSLARLLLVQSK
jgi:hypothetical protein